MEKRNLKISTELVDHIPVIRDLIAARETFWINPRYRATKDCKESGYEIGFSDILDADQRMRRFAPYLAKAFPETQSAQGLIESPLVSIAGMHRHLEVSCGIQIPGELYMKCDNLLPISGSIKARGGIYEVLKHAEGIALGKGLITKEDDYSLLMDSSVREVFSQYRIAVGSTGNLGLSIGVIGAKLGFKVTVHMSADAKEWKKTLLRTKGVEVIEYSSDYSKAVKEGRRQAEGDPHCYFVDDENSKDLFLGYAVAALRLKDQLQKLDIKVDSDHPLFVYLPCGVGGGPGGVTYGLKHVFQDNVHCFFAEPTHSPCMLLGLATGLHDRIAVQDIGLDNKTEADGLAVGRASHFVGRIMEGLLSGVYTIEDEELFCLLRALEQTQGILCEPSALAGMAGPARLILSQAGGQYLETHQLEDKLKNGTHLIWATGGSLVPEGVMKEYLLRGRMVPMSNEKIKTKIVLSDSFDPWHNLALEEFLLHRVEKNQVILYLWQNQNTVVIGRNQNPWKECRCTILEQDGGKLARRLSGGGAVFHDLGNLNFTFIMDRELYDLSKQLQVILEGVRELGIQAEFTGRNDLTVEGKKFSGNAFYFEKDKAYHHGTVLVHVDGEKVAKYLQVSKEKMAAKGVQSVQSRITNLRNYLPDLSIEEMKETLMTSFQSLYGECQEEPTLISATDLELKRLYEKYSSWDWRYGKTPQFDLILETRFPWGGIELGLNLNKGRITGSTIYSDAMNAALIQEIRDCFLDKPLNSEELATALDAIKIQEEEKVIIEDTKSWLKDKVKNL